jgi:hypothetical protein
MKKNKNNKAALEISFSWIFALIAGAVILFFAIYFVSKLMNTQQEIVSAETGKEIGILLNPLETSFESGQTTSITIPAETRIHNKCELIGNFGEQSIQLDQKSFGKWTKTEINVGFGNKYIFSSEEIEGKKFYIFSKPFDFPFKVADLVYMTSSNEIYCFVNAPDEIATEINDLNQTNLLTENCSSDKIRVCFGSSSCNVNVDYNEGIVEKKGEVMYFAGREESSRALMYAAIFSNKEVYECQLNRLMLRTREISILFKDKELITEKKGCDTNLGSDFNEFIDMISNFKSSEELGTLKMKAEDIDEKNRARMCMLW